jgi:hypothetical protein
MRMDICALAGLLLLLCPLTSCIVKSQCIQRSQLQRTGQVTILLNGQQACRYVEPLTASLMGSAHQHVGSFQQANIHAWKAGKQLVSLLLC